MSSQLPAVSQGQTDEMQSCGAFFRKTPQQQQLEVNNQHVTGKEKTSLAVEIKHYSLLCVALLEISAEDHLLSFPLVTQWRWIVETLQQMQISTLHSLSEIVRGHNITSQR